MPQGACLLNEAPMNVGDNYNRPKVLQNAFVKLGYMLENLLYLRLLWYNKLKVDLPL